MSYSGYRSDSSDLLHGSSSNLRDLLIRNYHIFTKIVRPERSFLLDFDSTASENFGLNLKMQKKLKAELKLENKTF